MLGIHWMFKQERELKRIKGKKMQSKNKGLNTLFRMMKMSNLKKEVTKCWIRIDKLQLKKMNLKSTTIRMKGHSSSSIIKFFPFSLFWSHSLFATASSPLIQSLSVSSFWLILPTHSSTSRDYYSTSNSSITYSSSSHSSPTSPISTMTTTWPPDCHCSHHFLLEYTKITNDWLTTIDQQRLLTSHPQIQRPNRWSSHQELSSHHLRWYR